MGEKRVFSMARTQSIYIHLVLNSTLYIFVSRKGCPAMVEILSRLFIQACGVRPFIHTVNSEGCRGRNTIRPPRLAGFEEIFCQEQTENFFGMLISTRLGSTPPSWASIGKWRPSPVFWECRVPCTLKNRCTSYFAVAAKLSTANDGTYIPSQ